MKSPIAKALIAVLGAVVLSLYSFLDDDKLVTDEWFKLGAAAVGAFLVWQTTNGPKGEAWYYAKTISYVLSAVLATASLNYLGGFTRQEVIELVIVAAAAAGVLVWPNRDPNHVVTT